MDRIKVGVVIPTINRTDLLIGALNSLETRHELKLFIINNAIHNLSVAAAWNRGVQAAIRWGAERILISNDDVIFLPSTLDRLVERAIDGSFPYLLPLELRALGYAADCLDQYPLPDPGYEIDAVQDHSCVVLDPQLYREIGPYDEGCPMAYWEDTDYFVRIRLAGRRHRVTTYAAFFHYGAASAHVGGSSLERLEQGRAYLLNKYRGLPGAAEAFTAIGRDPQSLGGLGTHPDFLALMRRV